MSVTEDTRVRQKNPLVTALLVGPVVLVAALAALRLTGFDGNWYTLVALSLTPYAAALALLVGVLALVLRRWGTGVVAVLLAIALTALVLPRLLPNDQPAAHGKTVRVLSSNLLYGQADPKAVVDLVRTQRIDVLNLVEMTPRMVDGLTAAGLFETLPHRVLHPAPGAFGSGIASRFPLKEVGLAGGSAVKQPGAQVDLGDGVLLEDVAVHPVSPDVDLAGWRRETGDLPGASPEQAPRILAGDFNATLDHSAFRAVVSHGYADAADERGDGLNPTWPKTFVPLVTIDHVLVDKRVAVLDYQVFDVAGSDHRAVFAEVRLP